MPNILDVGENIVDTGKDLVDKVSDTISGVFEGVKETADSVLHPIDSLLGNWGSDLLEASMKIANKTTFDIPNIELISTITNVFVFATKPLRFVLRSLKRKYKLLMGVVTH